jgi:hypothetical protein
VDPDPISKLKDGFDDVHLARVEQVIGPEAPGQLEPLLQGLDGDHTKAGKLGDFSTQTSQRLE